MNNPIKYPIYQENGVDILTLDANDVLIYLYKLYAYKKAHKELEHFLVNHMSELYDPLNLDETETFNAIAELKSQGLVTATSGSDQYIFISLTPKAIAYYEHAVGREIKKYVQSVKSLIDFLKL